MIIYIFEYDNGKIIIVKELREDLAREIAANELDMDSDDLILKEQFDSRDRDVIYRSHE